MELNFSWEAGSFPVSREIPSMLWARMFITVLTRACHWSLWWATSTKSTRNCPVSVKSLLILSHLRHGFPSGLFPSVFPHQNTMNFSCLPCVLHALLIPFFWSNVYCTFCNIPHYASFEASLSSLVLDPNFSPTLYYLSYVLTSLWVSECHTHARQQAKLHNFAYCKLCVSGKWSWTKQ
jgi:hypothetical protein